MVLRKGIRLKKKFGQHFLRNPEYAYRMVHEVNLDQQSSVFEIGCGDGFLTRIILQNPLKRLLVFEIDVEWASYVKKNIVDNRLSVINQDFLTVDMNSLEPYAPWILLANLPYQITFPILHRLQEHRALLKEGVIMVQEEVAQKIIKTSGKGYGFVSLFFQYYFTWLILDKIPPTAFEPPPKIFSRLLYFKPQETLVPIPDEDQFWQFIKACFKQPRRTLKNNLQQTHFDVSKISSALLEKRAQQLNFDDLLHLWNSLHSR